jgi:hypothetical protein
VATQLLYASAQVRSFPATDAFYGGHTHEILE